MTAVSAVAACQPRARDAATFHVKRGARPFLAPKAYHTLTPGGVTQVTVCPGTTVSYLTLTPHPWGCYGLAVTRSLRPAN